MRKIRIPLIIILLIILAFQLARAPLAKSFNSKGMISYNEEKYEQAERYFIKAVQLKGKYAEALINLIKCQFQLEKMPEAEKHLQKLTKSYPDLAESKALSGKMLVLNQDFDEAILQLDAAIEIDSLLAYAYFYRGIAKANKGLLEEAANDYLKAQEIDQTNTEALLKGAIVFSKLENFEAAIQNYDILLELDPSNTSAYLERGNFKMKIGDYQHAIDDFNSTLQLDNTQAEAYFNRGKSYARINKYNQAIADFDEAIKLDYKTPGANYNAGLASLRLGNSDMAYNYLTACVALTSNNDHTSNAYHLLGLVHMMRNESVEAIKNFDRSIELDPEYADAYYNRGIANGILQNYEKAVDDLDRAIELGKTSSDVYFARGVHKISMHQYDAGCEDLAKAEELENPQAKAMIDQYCK